MFPAEPDGWLKREPARGVDPLYTRELPIHLAFATGIPQTASQARASIMTRPHERGSDPRQPRSRWNGASPDSVLIRDGPDTQRGGRPVEGTPVIAGRRTADSSSRVADKQHGGEELQDQLKHR